MATETKLNVPLNPEERAALYNYAGKKSSPAMALGRMGKQIILDELRRAGFLKKEGK